MNWQRDVRTGLYLGSLALCWLLALEFRRSLRPLLLARQIAAKSPRGERLDSLKEMIKALQGRDRGWPLPRLGLGEAEALEDDLRRRFLSGYRRLKIIPEIDKLKEQALSAAGSGRPADIGDSLLSLQLVRNSLAGAGENRAARPAMPTSIAEMALAAGVVSTADLSQLDAYVSWGGREVRMPEEIRALGEIEHRLLAGAAGGDALAWLPAWIGQKPGLLPPEAGKREAGIHPAFTLAGYLWVRKLLLAAPEEGPEDWPARREACLAAWRGQALELWRREARKLWRDFPAGAFDREAGRVQDPASRLLVQLRENLFPLFAEDRSNPEIEWLRRLDALSGPPTGSEPTVGGEDRRKWRIALDRLAGLINAYADNLAAVRRSFRRGKANPTDRFLPGDGTGGAESDPLGEAKRAAENLERRLIPYPDDPAWDGLSPLTSFNYHRLIAISTAAFSLDAMWRENVLHPWRLHPGGPLERWRRLTEPGGLLDNYLRSVSGLWRLEDGRLAKAEWDGIAFPFNLEFLDFVNGSVGKDLFRQGDSFSIVIAVTSLDVDPGARERPTRLELVWRTADGDVPLVHRNHPGEAVWKWKPGTRAKIRLGISLPSVYLVKDFPGEAEVAGLLLALADQAVILEAEDFPGQEENLRRLGIARFVIHSRVREPEELRNWLSLRTLELPKSVIDLGRGMAARLKGPEEGRAPPERRQATAPASRDGGRDRLIAAFSEKDE